MFSKVKPCRPTAVSEEEVLGALQGRDPDKGASASWQGAQSQTSQLMEPEISEKEKLLKLCDSLFMKLMIKGKEQVVAA